MSYRHGHDQNRGSMANWRWQIASSGGSRGSSSTLATSSRCAPSAVVAVVAPLTVVDATPGWHFLSRLSFIVGCIDSHLHHRIMAMRPIRSFSARHQVPTAMRRAPDALSTSVASAAMTATSPCSLRLLYCPLLNDRDNKAAANTCSNNSCRRGEKSFLAGGNCRCSRIADDNRWQHSATAVSSMICCPTVSTGL